MIVQLLLALVIEVHSTGSVWQGRASGDRILGTGDASVRACAACSPCPWGLVPGSMERGGRVALPWHGWRKTEEKSECVLLVLQSMY